SGITDVLEDIEILQHIHVDSQVRVVIQFNRLKAPRVEIAFHLIDHRARIVLSDNYRIVPNIVGDQPDGVDRYKVREVRVEVGVRITVCRNDKLIQQREVVRLWLASASQTENDCRKTKDLYIMH